MTLHKLLSGLLLLQVGLAALAWWPEDRSSLTPRSLLEIEIEEIVELRIARKPAEGLEADVLHLVRGENAWTLASAGDYPAAPDKVDELLDKLVSLEVQSPIATRSENHNALKVGDKEYGRRVEIGTASGSTELIIGAAASNSVHVRLADASEVYVARGVSEWSLRDNASSYYDANYVQADVSELTQLLVHNDSGTLSFVREAGEVEGGTGGEAGEGGAAWRLEEAPEGSALDQDEIESFLETITKVRIAEPVGRELKPEYGLEADASGVRVDWAMKAENQSLAGGYRLGASVESHTYVKATDSPFVIKAADSGFEKLRQAKAADFVVEDEG
jgi:hypothetical protein